MSFLARPRRFWSPTWPQLGPILEPCWLHFGPFLDVLLASQLKMTFKTISCRFLTAFRFSASSKTPPLPMILKMFAIFACSLLRPILDRFWDDFGTKNRPKIGPKRVPKGVQNHVRFLVLSRPSKNRFLPYLAATWPPRWPQVGTKMGPKSEQKGIRKRSRLRSRFWIDFGTILG